VAHRVALRSIRTLHRWRKQAGTPAADVARLQAILNAAVAAIITADEFGTIVDVNPATEKLFGYRSDELMGARVDILLSRPELSRQEFLKTDFANSNPAKPRQILGRRKDGTVIPLHLAVGSFTLNGRRYFTGILFDETDRKEFERNLRSALSAANMVAMKWDCRTNIVSVTSGGALTAPTRSVTTVDQLLKSIDPDDVSEFRREVLLSGKTRKPFRIVLRQSNPAGQSQWLELDAQTEADDNGNPLFVHGILRDVTESKREEARRELLLAEIAHRGKNLLAVVQSIAAVTFRGDRHMEAARAEFEQRLAALARSQALLSEQEWSGVELADIVTLELAAYATQAVIEVDAIRLKPSAAQSMSLIIHELATNAAKYGALSVPQGEIIFSARLRQQEDDEVLQLSWKERGGPPVTPPSRKGYGSFLIEELLEGMAKESRVDFHPEGLVVEATIATAQLRPAHKTWVFTRADKRPDSKSPAVLV